MSTFIAVCLVVWIAYQLNFSPQAKKKKADKKKFWHDLPIVFKNMADDPAGDMHQKHALELIDNPFFLYPLAISQIIDVTKACSACPDNQYNWFVLEAMLNKNVLKQPEFASDMLGCCRAGLLAGYADKQQRERIAAILDKIANIQILKFAGEKKAILSAVYDKALEDLQQATAEDKTRLKIAALDVGRLLYRDKITVQDEQKIQNDILMRS